jgi:hypothetical protein
VEGDVPVELVVGVASAGALVPVLPDAADGAAGALVSGGDAEPVEVGEAAGSDAAGRGDVLP